VVTGGQELTKAFRLLVLAYGDFLDGPMGRTQNAPWRPPAAL